MRIKKLKKKHSRSARVTTSQAARHDRPDGTDRESDHRPDVIGGRPEQECSRNTAPDCTPEPTSESTGPAEETRRPLADRTMTVVRDNMRKILLVTVAAVLLLHADQRLRVIRFLRNRLRWGISPPLVMLAVVNDAEHDAAMSFATSDGRGLGDFRIVRQKGHNRTVGNAIKLFHEVIDPTADLFTVKRQTLCLTRRGGIGKPTFITPFTAGAGTTCGEWTRPVVRNDDGTVIKGFMKASVAVGFCPVRCPFCYLNGRFTDVMDVSLNWGDLARELLKKWSGFEHPINFGETSGLVEYDEWLAEPDGTGSVIQYVIDACAAAKVTPFFLTKIRYPRYLRFHGRVQVGISLMPEPIREWLAPFGSPADELLDSLAWSWSAGAIHPVIRLAAIWQHKDLYPAFLDSIVERMGTSGWRLTLDILRFTPGTASIIAQRYPEESKAFAEEIAPGQSTTLSALARDAKRSAVHVKKLRPPEDRQVEIFTWFRNELNARGCQGVLLTPCKGNPEELTPLARQKIINAMPCACYGYPASDLVQLTVK